MCCINNTLGNLEWSCLVGIKCQVYGKLVIFVEYLVWKQHMIVTRVLRNVIKKLCASCLTSESFKLFCHFSGIFQSFLQYYSCFCRTCLFVANIEWCTLKQMVIVIFDMKYCNTNIDLKTFKHKWVAKNIDLTQSINLFDKAQYNLVSLKMLLNFN